MNIKKRKNWGAINKENEFLAGIPTWYLHGFYFCFILTLHMTTHSIQNKDKIDCMEIGKSHVISISFYGASATCKWNEVQNMYENDSCLR